MVKLPSDAAGSHAFADQGASPGCCRLLPVDPPGTGHQRGVGSHDAHHLHGCLLRKGVARDEALGRTPFPWLLTHVAAQSRRCCTSSHRAFKSGECTWVSLWRYAVSSTETSKTSVRNRSRADTVTLLSGRFTSHSVKDFRSVHGSSQGQNLALTGSCVASSLDSDMAEARGAGAQDVPAGGAGHDQRAGRPRLHLDRGLRSHAPRGSALLQDVRPTPTFGF